LTTKISLARLNWHFASSLPLLLFGAFLSFLAVITRVLDFRLTARKVRKKQNPNYDCALTLFGFDDEAYGKATWRLFWASCFFFMAGMIMLIVTISIAYAKSWHY
jgi:hypothetical protein